MVGEFGLVWLCASNALVLEVALLELVPHDLRLCARRLALVLGLYVMDFAYFAKRTASNTLKRCCAWTTAYQVGIAVLS